MKEFKWLYFCEGKIIQRGWLKAKKLHEAKHLARLDAGIEKSGTEWVDRDDGKSAILPVSGAEYLALILEI